ncbi:MAG TPA: MliC family protein [Archangium sp.]|uniref:MliC family protein n=1 Tax=Archangium sp. TaxID=1872627 RepID=UPI002E2F4CA7|nr:MliC family protein [Archangium sp.]HEX5751812.1 MliC family protein [Archangium sp.]
MPTRSTSNRIAPAALVLMLAGCQHAPESQTVPSSPAPAAAAPVNPGPGIWTYVCENGETLRADYPGAGTAVVERNGRTHPLKAARAASGARYTGPGLQWWTRGTHATLSQLKPGEELASDPGVVCRVSVDAPVSPPPPGAPGGLPDDRTPLSEAPTGPKSPQAAGDVVQTYFALLEAGKYGDAWRLWSDDGKASQRTEAGFAADFDRYASYHAQVGAPGRPEGAAGSVYVQVPVVIYGRFKAGNELHQSGTVTLRRINDVPGSTEEQRRWHIFRIELSPETRGLGAPETRGTP